MSENYSIANNGCRLHYFHGSLCLGGKSPVPGDAMTPLTVHSQVSGTRPIIIEFWAEWCATCKPMTELFDQLAAQNPAGEFYRLDIEEVREVSQELGVRNVRVATREDHERGVDDGRSAARIQSVREGCPDRRTCG
ncbi:hypothetical protein EV363DRAFT_1330319 [Boletus edulis]|nr:hypothetical protein EV363DRAFT_1330319 [Boletus edulis]